MRRMMISVFASPETIVSTKVLSIFSESISKR